MNSLVAQIQGNSGTAVELNQLRNYLSQHNDLPRADPARLTALLAELDPTIHSLGYLYILDACTSGHLSKERANEMVLSVARFINLCDEEQIRMAPEKFISICKRLKEQVLVEDPIRGVAPLLTAVKKLQPSPEHLTTLHPDFLFVCLLSKCYKTGLSILEDDIFEVDQPRDLFLYCYYGGMICIGQKKFPKALELLHIAVTSPMNVVSAIAVEAYKKYILISLIHTGQFSTILPKYTSQAAQRNLKNFTQLYLELVTSYNKGKILELETFVQSNLEKFDSDRNLGLVKQVVSSMYKRNIQRLTQTYLTLSLQDIADIVELGNPKEAEMHILQMIQAGEIFASINQKDGMVRFLEDPEQYKTHQMIESIDSEIQRKMMISKKLTSKNELLAIDPAYLGKVGRERQRFDFDDFDAVPSRFNI